MRSIITVTIAAVTVLAFFTKTAMSVERYEPMNGWAGRLDSVLHSLSDREIHSSTLVLPDESGPLLLLVKYVFNMAQLWNFQEIEETVEEVVKPKKVWSNFTSR